MRKIEFGHEAWRKAEEIGVEPAIRELVEQFRECPDTSMDSDVFAELWEEASCPKGHVETYTIRGKGIADSSNRSVSVQDTGLPAVNVR